ncbi:hypothetical protein [Anatilimnocola floriformis]|uniref:hypothetical protein n=1 Tax=Anatilimnocola floriformis TaxID=2948575 RepID=UPI0020C5A22B|nr:hypothetical protein [Anatilimnocola floriformis]
MRTHILFAATVFFLCLSSASFAEDTALAIFQKRIAPILQAQRPSSCSECHLSGVDLKDYIRPTQPETFAALRDGGLIDVQQPGKSKLLQFIDRKPAKPSIVTEKIRAEESAAFRAWIEAAVKDPSLAAAKATDTAIGPQLPPEVIRHARQDRVLQSFLDNVWAEAGRCAACHSPDRNAQQVKKHGEHISWMKLRDPQATLAHLLEHELIDLKEPEKSLLLLKPLKKVEHGGGVKMTFGDRTYQQFRKFIDDYAATQAGQYKTAKELPQPSNEAAVVSEIWFKLTDIPAEYDQLVLRLELYPFDEQTKKFSSERWATADRQIFGKGGLWQNHLSLVAPKDSPRAKELLRNATLPAGKYLAKIYLDRNDKLTKEYPAQLGAKELLTEIEVNSRWPAGYGAMTAVKLPR